MKDVLSLEYAVSREKRPDFRYRLKRRTYEALRAIEKFRPEPRRILDLGTAEGRMLEKIRLQNPGSLCVGADYSRDLLGYGAKKFPEITFIRADIGNLGFLKDGSFDVIIATAVIEHLVSPDKMLAESLRLLKAGGIIIITSPHPFWEKISHVLGMLRGAHQSVMSPEKMLKLCEGAGFNALEHKGFMISPVGMPGELYIERLIARIGLDKFLPNQLIVAGK